MTPISIEQTTLIKFFPQLKKRGGWRQRTAARVFSIQQDYSLILEPNDDLKIKETHCLKCDSRLIKNGWNSRVLIFEKKRERKLVRLMRKRCPKCGEIKPDLSKIAPKNAIYHEKFRKMARQHYMEGLMPSQIKRVFKIDFGIDISKSSIVNWINEVAEPLREMLKDTPVPSSGYWGYDEIHMKIAGKKRYTIDTVDLNTKFVPVARITKNMGRTVGSKVLKEGRKRATLDIKGLVKDCSTNLGGLFKSFTFKNVKLQNCKTHVKWIIHRDVKTFSGLSQGSTKPVPKKWRWLLKRFYKVIDSSSETDAYVKLEILRSSIQKLKEKRVSRLVKAFRQLEKWLPKLIAHQRDPFLPSTNNLLESFHKKYNYYPSFKKHMKTEGGAQRVLDYRVFRHNLGRFPNYIDLMHKKYTRFKQILSEIPNPRKMIGHGKYFKSEFRKLDTWYKRYLQLWEEYFAI